MDFRLATSIKSHPKIVKLRRRLGAEGVLAYIFLLAHVAECKRDGRLTGMDAEDIAIAGTWDGEAKAFVDALIELRLLDATDDGLAIHDWAQNNPYVASFPARSEAARKAVNARWEQERMRKDTERIRDVSNRNTPSPIPTPTPSPNPEEKNKSAAPESDAPEAASEPELSPSAQWPEEERWLLDFLDNEQRAFNGHHLPRLRDHEFWDQLSITTNGLDKAFVQRAFAEMRIWLKDHPARGPTPKGVRRFVGGWLQRNAERERRQRA